MIVEVAALILIAFLAGFTWGKKIGRKEGFRQGSSEVPLVLRENMLSEGRCCLCQSPLSHQRSQPS